MGGFCKEGPGAEKGNQSGQLSGVPCGGTGALTPGQGRVPGLRPSLDHQAAGLGQHLVCGPDEPQPHGIRGGRWIAATADPAPLQCPVGRSLLPALCQNLPILPCGGKLIWKEGLGRKIR